VLFPRSVWQGLLDCELGYEPRRTTFSLSVADYQSGSLSSDSARLIKRVYISSAVTVIFKDLAGMLSQVGCGAIDLSWCIGKMNGTPHRLHLTQRRMVYLHNHTAC
jgi:hypothetical protein